jgi:hypothetical protein
MSIVGYVEYRIRLSDLEEDRKREALHNLLRASAAEASILFDIFEVPNTWRYTAEILRGAHLRIHDSGALYDAWKGLHGADTRGSSHKSDAPQYHVDGPLVHTVLFGRLDGRTWVQLEGRPVGIGHLIDYFRYRITHKNQGPYGASEYRESRPLEFLPAVDD